MPSQDNLEYLWIHVSLVCWIGFRFDKERTVAKRQGSRMFDVSTLRRDTHQKTSFKEQAAKTPLN